MADIEVVVKIPEHYYENNIKKELPICLSEDNIVAILPRGLGKLKDVDKIYNEIDALNRGENKGRYTAVLTIINMADMIIEADKE